ncbi:MAG: hypothetical protein RI894_622 [Bacteroidota bacterium]|jgi:hypothetical protein
MITVFILPQALNGTYFFLFNNNLTNFNFFMKYLILTISLLGLLACGGKQAKTEAAAGAETTAVAPSGDVAKMLEGKWQSVEDAKAVKEIGGGKIVDIYEGKKMTTNKFEFSADCSGNACAEGKTAKGCFSSAGEFDIECFSVINVSDTELEVSLVGGAGKSNHYKKMK